MKIKSKLAIILLIFLFVISPISISKILDHVQAAGYEVISADQEWTEDKIIEKSTFIESGVTVTIKKGVTITFNNKNIYIDGNVVVNGTKKDPVIFKKAESSQNYSIVVQGNGNLTMRNVDISGGGDFYFHILQNNSFTNNVYAETYGEYQGAIHANGGSLNIQSVNFHDNGVAVYVTENSVNKVTINRSSFSNNSKLDVGFTENNQNLKLDCRHNWWGSSQGPNQTCVENDNCSFDKIVGAVDVSNWVTREDFHDPVIIIPGVLGSQEKNGRWYLDLTFHVYDNLYDEFAKNGYTPEEDLFKFPYQWRDSNIENAKLLRDKINEIKQVKNWPKVDVVAHSMGGLLAREYIESDYYQDDVDQLVTLGTPHLGAPEAYLKWEGDAWFWSPSDIYAKHILDQEAKENEYDTIFEYLHKRPISSLQELLPVYEYIQDVDNSYAFRVYPNNYPRNEFLENLNSDDKKQKLKLIEFDKISGNVSSSYSTVSGFKVIIADFGKYWQYGYPLGFEIPLIGDQGIINGLGDGTVPIESARSVDISSDEYIEINSSHVDLPTEAQRDVLELLTAKRPEKESQIPLIVNMLIIQVYSPIDLQIISPSGKKYGKNFENNQEFESIGGSFYTGFDTKNEFITIPNPEDGEYRVLTQGTGEGEYHIEIAKISENSENLQNPIESEITIGGTALPDKISEAKIKVTGNEISQATDTTAPTIKIFSPQNQTYFNNQKLPISFEANDNVSKIENLAIEKTLDGQRIEQAEINLSLQSLGSHILKIKATDEANNIQEKEVQFLVTTSIPAIRDNVKFYYNSGMIKSMQQKNVLLITLKVIQKRLDFLEKIQQNSQLKPFVKKSIQKIVLTQIKNHLNFLVKQINHNFKKYDPVAKNLLLEDLNWLRNDIGAKLER